MSLQAALHFNVGYIAIDFASLVFLVMFVPSSVIVPLLVNKGGYRVTMYTAAVATVVGVWVRMIDANSYTAVIIGQTLAAVGQPIIFANIPAVSQGACHGHAGVVPVLGQPDAGRCHVWCSVDSSPQRGSASKRGRWPQAACSWPTTSWA